MNRKQKRHTAAKGSFMAGIAVISLCVFVAIFVHDNADHFSDGTNGLLADAVTVIDAESEKELHSLFPVSKNTKSLLTESGVVLQNNNYLKDENATAPPVIIGEDEQNMIVNTIASDYPEDSAAPWNNGYAGKCEQWVCEVYDKAGLPTIGSCCAARSRKKLAEPEGDIPLGAMIYSSEDYKSGNLCEICGDDPGHVAIYLGNNKVAGSQPLFIMTLSEFKKMYGYGGWSYSGNIYKQQ